MKLKSLIALLALGFMTVSCGVLGGIGAGNAASGTVNGQASGAALKSLYTQYKTDGKVELNNINNVLSLAQLANGIQGLKGIDDKSQFYTDFASGLILGSNNLVTQQTSNPVTSTLSSLVSGTDLTQIAAAGLAAAAQSKAGQQAQAQTQQGLGSVLSSAAALSEKTAGVANTISSLNTIFNMFAK